MELRTFSRAYIMLILVYLPHVFCIAIIRKHKVTEWSELLVARLDLCIETVRVLPQFLYMCSYIANQKRTLTKHIRNHLLRRHLDLISVQARVRWDFR